MTPLEFIKAKYGDHSIHSDTMANFSKAELAELIEEYEQIQGHIQEGHVTLDNTPIPAKDWIDYNNRYLAWWDKYEGNFASMDAAMSRPNKPNYFTANND